MKSVFYWEGRTLPILLPWITLSDEFFVGQNFRHLPEISSIQYSSPYHFLTICMVEIIVNLFVRQNFITWQNVFNIVRRNFVWKGGGTRYWWQLLEFFHMYIYSSFKWIVIQIKIFKSLRENRGSNRLSWKYVPSFL